MKFKVSDKVRIIDCRGIEPYELNKIGTIVDVMSYGGGHKSYVVDMGRPRRPHDLSDNETCWWLNEWKIELAPMKGEQLLFDFMQD